MRVALLLGFLLLARPAWAGDSPLGRLSSPEPCEQAWGAYEAGAQGARDAIPLLERLLGQEDRGDGPSAERQYVVRCALDALIRLGASPPPSVILPHEGRFVVPVLILLARDPVGNRDLLGERLARGLAREPPTLGLYGVACGNLLLAQRAPGFAATVLGRIELTLRVRVVAPDDSRGYGGSRSLGGGSGDYLARIPEGFPPYVAWALDDGPGPGRALLADGPQPVYVVRRERATPGVLPGTTTRHLEPPEVLRTWLAALLGDPLESFALRLERGVRIAWAGPEDCRRRADAAREELGRPWHDALRRLREVRLLTEEEALGLVPRVKVVVDDRRPEPREPLPPL